MGLLQLLLQMQLWYGQSQLLLQMQRLLQLLLQMQFSERQPVIVFDRAVAVADAVAVAVADAFQ